jgi:DNA-binding response OmpR family regulator
VIILSSSPNEHDIARARELGADFYLVKPVNYKQLVQMARSIVAFAENGQWPPALPESAPLVFPLRPPAG